MSENVFCPIPWNFLAIRSNGDLRVCCQANQSKSRGIIRKESGVAENAASANLNSVRNSKLLKNMRSKMLKNEWPEECVRCQGEEVSGLRSRREYERENWFIDNDYVREKTNDDGSIEVSEFPLQYIDLRFGNLCNLACRMCGPSDSSSWYDDHVKLTGQERYNDTHGQVSLTKNAIGKYQSNDYNWYQSDNFWKELESLSSGIKHIYMAGGEPLLIDKHFEFLEMCIDKDISKKIILEYNTNLTVLNDRVLSLWSHFLQVRVGASIDGMGDVLEYQRYPAKWSIINENLKLLDNLGENIISWLAFTVTNYNVFHLADFIRWKLTESNFKKINSSRKKPIITHHMCHSPHHLNIRSLPLEMKDLVRERYKELEVWAANSLDQDRFLALKSITFGILKYMDTCNYNKWDQFIEYTVKLDKIRGQDIKKVVPEYSSYFQS